jgi:Calcineurin-like phosphoesterase
MAQFAARNAARHRLTRAVGVVILYLACSQCSGNNGVSPPTQPTLPVVRPPTTPPPQPTPPPVFAPQTFAGAGDIALCDQGNSIGVGKLLDTVGGTLFTLGDNAYMNGTFSEFENCYGPTWGRWKARTRPTPGNHEYHTPGASAYFEYFGANAGPPGLGYYSFELGAWHVISLNSEIDTGRNSAQGIWLQNDLATNRSKCTIAYWHKPLFSSGPNGNHPHMQPFWQILYQAGVDVVMNGHDHLYERFGPQDPEGRPDPRLGIRQFIVGTGGVPLYDFRTALQPNSERRMRQHGILNLTLMNDSYLWEFVPVSRTADQDSGSDQCH